MRITITADGRHRGLELYRVSDGVDRLFTGTLEEVKTFLTIHQAKVRERREAEAALLRAARAG